MSTVTTRPSVSSAICYRDPKTALRWLEDAFGFEPTMVILDTDGNLLHSEMQFGNGLIMVGNEWSESHRSPVSINGLNTQTVHLQLETDLDAHCETARAAGAIILQEPETQFYGDRTYRATDPEGHIWTFGQTVTAMSSEQWDAAIGSITLPRLP
ncbi:MAG: VOC family protein [Pseudomonadales bacterium]|nr:VOC family protein [Pseudomonadales bacterium]MCP5183069.1 VOC family protein [Pseudomonadales bacterium]